MNFISMFLKMVCKYMNAASFSDLFIKTCSVSKPKNFQLGVLNWEVIPFHFTMSPAEKI